MSPAELIRLAAADGVRLSRSRMSSELRVLGRTEQVDRWMAQLRANKSAVLMLLDEREERAGIYEYDAKLSRVEAEKKAGL